MKTLFALALALFVQVGSLMAQSELPELNLKFGKPTEAEMKMTVYPLDTTATAVYLMESCELSYHMATMYEISMRYFYKFRIKILKEEGKEYGNIEIPFRRAVSRAESDYDDTIDNLSVIAYNMNEKGKVSGYKVDPSNIFEERVNDEFMVRKVSVPQVRVGTVIECKYEVGSMAYFQIKDYLIQREIPVIYAEYKMEIPAVLQFNVAAPTSSPRIQGSVKTGSMSIDKDVNNKVASRMPTNIYHIIGRQLPAVKKDDFVWCPSDYRARVECDLKSTQFPGSSYNAQRRTWEEIDDLLLHQDEIGPRMSDKSKFGEEMTKLEIDQLPTAKEKVQAAVRLLLRHVAWNGDYDILPNSASSVLKKQSGSSADLNMLLINMLNDLGLKSSPVFLSTRRNGILPIHPSVKAFNTMIVAVDVPEGELYVDATRGLAPLNVLTPNYYVEQARLVSKHRKSQFVNLTNNAQSRTKFYVQATLDADGTLTGEAQMLLSGNAALEERYAYVDAKDSAAYVHGFSEEHGIEVQSMKMTGYHDNSDEVANTIAFTKSAEATDDHIYLNPFLLIPVEESPFKSEERELPIELSYKDNQSWSVSITMPEGYEVEAAPKNFTISTPDKMVNVKGLFMVRENVITLSYSFSTKKMKFKADEYSAVKSVYDMASQRLNDMIVLKKQ